MIMVSRIVVLARKGLHKSVLRDGIYRDTANFTMGDVAIGNDAKSLVRFENIPFQISYGMRPEGSCGAFHQKAVRQIVVPVRFWLGC